MGDTDAEEVTRESGYIVFAEPRKGPAECERLATTQDVAKWVIDSYGCYLSNSTMSTMVDILESGGVASVEIATHELAMTLTVSHAK